MIDLLSLVPVPTLGRRIAQELSASFVSDRPVRFSHAPGRLDVMGGVADYTGGVVCELPLSCGAAVALQERSDRLVQVFSFNLLDEQLPFTLAISLDDLSRASIEQLRRNFNEPGRAWGGYVIGCLAVLQQEGLVDLHSDALRGLNIALYSTIPAEAGVGRASAVVVAAMLNLLDHLNLRDRMDGDRVARLCHRVSSEVVGDTAGLREMIGSAFGVADALLRWVDQPSQTGQYVKFPTGVRVVGFDSKVPLPDSRRAVARSRCAAFMAHRLILEEMRRFGQEAGRELIADPMHGRLANLAVDDYKRLFRGRLPEMMKGDEFIARYGKTIDARTQPEPDQEYAVQFAADHHVLEARRSSEFLRYLHAAADRLSTADARQLNLDKAGHLMYASHKSLAENAQLGRPGWDLVVDLVRKNERPGGLYGARASGDGTGSTIAILCGIGEHTDQTLHQILSTYVSQTGKSAELHVPGGAGGWGCGTSLTHRSRFDT